MVLAACAALVIAIWFWFGGERALWVAATTPATVTCTSENCIALAPIDAGHGGQDGLQLGYDPTIDDAVAQWGDCLESVLTCRGKTKDTRGCVAQSSCPETCRTGFARLAAGQTAEPALGQLFLGYFVEDGGACLPPAEDAQ